MIYIICGQCKCAFMTHKLIYHQHVYCQSLYITPHTCDCLSKSVRIFVQYWYFYGFRQGAGFDCQVTEIYQVLHSTCINIMHAHCMRSIPPLSDLYSIVLNSPHASYRTYTTRLPAAIYFYYYPPLFLFFNTPTLSLFFLPTYFHFRSVNTIVANDSNGGSFQVIRLLLLYYCYQQFILYPLVTGRLQFTLTSSIFNWICNVQYYLQEDIFFHLCTHAMVNYCGILLVLKKKKKKKRGKIIKNKLTFTEQTCLSSQKILALSCLRTFFF